MSLKPIKKISILYLFKKGRKLRLKNLENIPSEFFYGYRELSNENEFNLDLLEQSDIDLGLKHIFLNKFINIISRLLFNLPFQIILGLLLNKNYKKLRQKDFIVVTTNTMGIAISIANSFGLISSKVLFINMGLFKNNPNIFQVYFYRYIFHKVKLLTISKKEYNILKTLFNDKNVKYVRFGVDKNFWYPQKKIIGNPYALAIGNDLARDWETLVNAWDENFPNLKIVTSLPVFTSKKNIKIIRGDWHSQELTDEEMKDLYRDSEFVILPLKQTLQPSGQSTCLQAMACSKAVLISNINGIWDKKLLKHKENIFFVKPNDETDLNRAIKSLFINKELRTKLEENGRKLITDHFNISNMKKDIKKILEEY